MSPAYRSRPVQLVAAALLVLLVAQGFAVAALRSGAPVAAACARAVPQVNRKLPLDIDAQVVDDLSAGHHSRGTAVLVNRSSHPVVVISTQAVLLAPAGRIPVAPPEPPRPAGRLLKPGQFLRQDLTLVVEPCPGGDLPPGFYEVALVVKLESVRDGREVATVTPRRAVVVRP